MALAAKHEFGSDPAKTLAFQGFAPMKVRFFVLEVHFCHRNFPSNDAVVASRHNRNVKLRSRFLQSTNSKANRENRDDTSAIAAVLGAAFS